MLSNPDASHFGSKLFPAKCCSAKITKVVIGMGIIFPLWNYMGFYKVKSGRVAVGREFSFPFPQDFCGKSHTFHRIPTGGNSHNIPIRSSHLGIPTGFPQQGRIQSF